MFLDFFKILSLMNTNLILLIVDDSVSAFESYERPITSVKKDRAWQHGNVHYHN